MQSKHQPGYRYSLIVEPFWLSLNESWDEGPHFFLTRFQNVPIAAGHLYAAHWCQSEVCNGGLHQFFFNSTGLLAPEALEGFLAIGLIEWSAILSEAMQFFGPDYPREREIRCNLLPEPEGRKRDEWDPFVALDERFYAWEHAEVDRWERAADKYAESY